MTQYILKLGKERLLSCYLLALARPLRIRTTYEMCYVVNPLLGFVPHAVDLYVKSSVETKYLEYYYNNAERRAGGANGARETRRRS